MTTVWPNDAPIYPDRWCGRCRFGKSFNLKVLQLISEWKPQSRSEFPRERCLSDGVGSHRSVEILLPPFTKIATWLILPVVIRLSQRLSHACLSINLYTVKLRMAHYISYSLFDSPCYLDTRSNSRANTCVKARTFVCVVFIRFEPTSSEFFGESW